ncbi:MAG: carboxylating nicotinate-nucleotide diphosphorylase [Oscillospiraceae bacterium]|nr:carboxylating nicotinate-nucleotide diphosphorylase [Oscillospiraceae bacterium]
MKLPFYHIDDIIKTALKEDVNYLDISSCFILDETHRSTARYIARADGILCGLDAALRVFTLLDGTSAFETFFQDGDEIKKGDIIARVSCKTTALLQGERTSLNLLQHMSGVATMTNAAMHAVAGTNASVAETRKTLPGLRVLQKYAVLCGGGKNHRFNLSDAAMLKDNHIDAGGGITKAVTLLREKAGHTVKIEVETRNLDEVREALQAGADIIMLDNMGIAEMAEAVSMVNGRALTEASGDVTLDNIREVAGTGVDIISMGALTHSVKAFNVSLKIEKEPT